MLWSLRRTLGSRKSVSLMAFWLTVAAGASSVSAAIPANPEERQAAVAKHLEFGEFGRALKLAKLAANPAEKSTLLAMVADAQVRAGDANSASGSIRQMTDETQQQQARRNVTGQRALAGGAQADFGPLMQLIQEETSGGWETTGEGNGTISSFDQGVRVDPTGVMLKVSKEEQTGRLKDLGAKARAAVLNEELAQATDMRVISLKRLERAVAARLSEGKPIPESMQLMGGLTQVTHMFLYPQDGDIVLAGKAEAWKYNDAGVPVGTETGKPVARLDDFVDVLRAFSTNEQRHFSCSINPRQEGLKKLKDFVERSSKSPLAAGSGVRNFATQAQQQLGRQDIVYSGIDPESRVARVIIEADYRMKLVGIGRYPEAKIPSVFDLFTAEEQKSGKLDALRWWLTMKYDSVLHSKDGNGFEFVGSSVLCQSENQLLNDLGQQVQTGQSEGANRLFAEKFTEKYDELAKYDLVFADLKNVFDLSLVASLMHNQGAARKVGFNYGVFAADGAYQTAKFEVPREVESVVNHRVYRGRDVVVQVAGGVRADLGAVINDQTVFKNAAKVETTADQVHAKSELPARRWWWDAK